MNRPPPIRLNSRNSEDTPRSINDNSVTLPANTSARERRRRRNSQSKPIEATNENESQNDTANRKLTARSRSSVTDAESPRKSRASRRSTSQQAHENSAYEEN